HSGSRADFTPSLRPNALSGRRDQRNEAFIAFGVSQTTSGAPISRAGACSWPPESPPSPLHRGERRRDRRAALPRRQRIDEGVEQTSRHLRFVPESGICAVCSLSCDTLVIKATPLPWSAVAAREQELRAGLEGFGPRHEEPEGISQPIDDVEREADRERILDLLAPATG